VHYAQTSALRGFDLDHLADITDYIKILLSSEHYHLMLVQGPPGWGKSSLTRKVLGDLGQEHRELGSYCTPLALYNGLVDHPADLLLVDDCAGLFHNALSMALLNAATWPTSDGGPRLVKWTSTTELASASEVKFKGKIIVLTNAIPQTPQAQAFISRSLCYRLEIQPGAVEKHLAKAASEPKRFPDTSLALEIARFLGQQSEHHSAEHISLRTLRLGYELASVNRDRWQTLLLKALPRVQIDPKELVVDLSKGSLLVEEQVSIFFQKTGLSRRRFFYFREALGLKKEPQAKPAPIAASIRKKVKSIPVAASKKPIPKVAPVTRRRQAKAEVQYSKDFD